MADSYHGKILHVDLTDTRTWVEELPPLTYRKYLGGGALATYFLLRDLPAGVEPLSPDNLLMFMTSVINGLPLSGANRYTAAGKSPLTGGFGEAEAGGYWGPELKRSGFDGIIVHGRAARPTYLFVHDGVCEFHDATATGAASPRKCRTASKRSCGDKSICVLQTGISGENRVRYAAITNQLRHYHGRAGLGAVMGSKNLRAIVTRGKERISPADKAAAQEVLRRFREVYDHENDGMHIHGTAGGITGLDSDGILPTRNFRDGSFEHALAITGKTMSRHHPDRPRDVLCVRGRVQARGRGRGARGLPALRRDGVRDHRRARLAHRRGRPRRGRGDVAVGEPLRHRRHLDRRQHRVRDGVLRERHPQPR